MSAVLERKVSLPKGKIHFFPNFFVLLVSHPSVGKSTALERGVDLLYEVRKHFNPALRILPTQMTEPSLLDLMKITDYFIPPGSTTTGIPQSAGYFWASEASSSALQNTCGDFIALMTALYDCPKFFEKKLKGEKHPHLIENACMNMIAGSTFDYLKNLVNESSVLGGFSSRCLYVIMKERPQREATWDTYSTQSIEVQHKLIEDLAHINKLMGPMSTTKGYRDAFLATENKTNKFLIDLDSPRLESLYARKMTHIAKLSMILSLAESDSRLLEEKHLREAEHMIEEVMEDTPFVLGSAVMSNVDKQEGINQYILQAMKREGGKLPASGLKNILIKSGIDVVRLEPTLKALQEAKTLEHLVEGGVTYIKLLQDPDIHL